MFATRRSRMAELTVDSQFPSVQTMRVGNRLLWSITQFVFREAIRTGTRAQQDTAEHDPHDQYQIDHLTVHRVPRS